MPVAALAALLLHALHYTAHWTDDAFITLRYARNLWTGQGLVFNPGQHVEGLTNLGWGLLLAPFTDGDGLRAARIIGLVCGLAALGLTLRALKEPLEQLVAACVLVAVPFFAYWSVQGMETPAVAVLVTAAWALYPREREGGLPLASFAMALAPWIRPDAAVLPFIVVAYHLATGGPRRTLLRGGAIVSVGGLALVATKLALFGSILPNTFHTKVQSDGWIKGVMYILNFGWEWGLGVLLLAALAWRFRSLPALMAGAYVAMCVAVGGDIFDNYRLLIPVFPAMAFCLAESARGRLRWPVVAGAVALGVGLVTTDRVRDLSRHENIPMPATQRTQKTGFLKGHVHWGWDDNAHGAWPAAWAVVNLPVDATISFTELGLFGYVQDNHIVDPLGLTEPELVGMYDPSDRVAWLSERTEVLFVDVTGGFFQKSKPALQVAGWQPVGGCDTWWVFAREDLAPPSETAERVDVAWSRVPHMSTFHALLIEEARIAGASDEDLKRWTDDLEGTRGAAAPVDCPGRIDPVDPPSHIWARPRVDIHDVEAPVQAEDLDCEGRIARARRAWQTALVEQSSDEAVAAAQIVVAAEDARAMKNASLDAVVLAEGPLAGMAHQETLAALRVCNPDRSVKPGR